MYSTIPSNNLTYSSSNSILFYKTMGITKNRFLQFKDMRKKIFENTYDVNNNLKRSNSDNRKIRYIYIFILFLFSLLDSDPESLNDINKSDSNLAKLNEEIELAEISSSSFDMCIEIFNSTNNMINKLLENYNILKSEQQQRLIPKFNDSENKLTDQKIKKLVINMTNSVKECEKNIKKLNNISFSKKEDEIIINNMKINLVDKVKNFTKMLRMNEQKYMLNFREFASDNLTEEKLDMDDEINYSKISDDSKNNFLQTTQVNNHLMKRDQDISELLNSISELSIIFKDLQTVVNEQGTILDRIDYNIDTASDNTNLAKKKLEKAKENLENNCFRNTIMILIMIVFTEALLLLFKFF